MKECIREAQVIDNVDPDKLGKIKVRIFPEMVEIPENLLPWATAYQFSGVGTMENVGTHAIPEIGSYIRVLIEDYPLLKRIRFISDDYVEGLYIYKAFETVEIDELGSQTYPQPFFKCYKDGTIDFHNSKTGEHGTFYKGGGYYLNDATGNVYLNTKTKEIKIYNDKGSINIKNTGDMEVLTKANTKIETSGTTNIKSTGAVSVESTATITIKGATVSLTGGVLTVNGSVTPNAGPFCALPACLFTGAPHTGNTVSGT